MHAIEVGGIKFHLSEEEDALELAGRLAEPIPNKRVAVLLGLSERSVSRRRRRGDLPDKPGEMLTMMEILAHVVPERLADVGLAADSPDVGDGVPD